jgi:hypothetical protein
MKVQNEQNNFKQINGVSFSREKLKQLPEEQIRQIDQIILNLVKIEGL